MKVTIIGMNPHKNANAAAAIDGDGEVLGHTVFPADRKGPRALERWDEGFPERRWAGGPSFEPPMPDRKVHTRSAGTIPTAVAVRLARDFGPETARLAERFGGYASFWSYCARRLTGAAPEGEHVPYPFWEWSAWEEWVGGTETGRPRFQSGPLPSVPAR